MVEDSNKKLWLASPHMSDEGYEMEYIQEAFDSNWISPAGANINEFEKELAQKVGASYAAAVSSGTAAIHLALKSYNELNYLKSLDLFFQFVSC